MQTKKQKVIATLNVARGYNELPKAIQKTLESRQAEWTDHDIEVYKSMKTGRGKYALKGANGKPRRASSAEIMYVLKRTCDSGDSKAKKLQIWANPNHDERKASYATHLSRVVREYNAKHKKPIDKDSAEYAKLRKIAEARTKKQYGK